MKTKVFSLLIGLLSLSAVYAGNLQIELLKNRSYSGYFTVYEDNGISRKAVLRFQQHKDYNSFFFKLAQSSNKDGSIHYELLCISGLKNIKYAAQPYRSWDSWGHPQIIIVGDPLQLGAY